MDRPGDALLNLAAGCVVLVLFCGSEARAAVASVTSGDALVGNRSVNLISNGSFESGGWTATGSGAGATSWVLTGTGTTLNGGSVVVPPGWVTSGDTLNYGVWGNDSTASSPGTGLHGSAALTDGSLGIYMGNQSVVASPAPTFLPGGEISFSSPPAYSHIPPVGYNLPFTLSQTVTGLDTSANYLLDFWVSGEDADAGGFFGAGMLELDITGESPIFLAVPFSPLDMGLGTSQRYYVQFQPVNATTTFSFINHGHLITGLNNIHTEAVLDDVVLNVLRGAGSEVPEGSGFWVGIGMLGLLGLNLRRRRRRS